MAEPITQAEKQLIAQIEAEGRERLKQRINEFNASPVKSETCKNCLLKYRDDFGRMIPICKLGTDVAGGLQDKLGGLKTLTPDEQTLMQVYRDPVLWAKLEFDWDARWYQSGAIRCSSKRKLYRFGRRTGKCLTEDALVYTRNGDRVPIRELVGKQITVQGVNPKTRQTIRRQSAQVSENIVQPVWRLTTADGRQITASLEHPFLTWKGWIELRDLRPGDEIAVPGIIRHEGNPGNDLPDHVIKLLAYAIGDGGVTQGCRITNILPGVQREVAEIAEALGCHVTWPEPGLTMQITDTPGRTNPAVRILDDHRVFGHKSHTKRVPSAVFRMRNEKVALFLSRLYACDGWASVAKAPPGLKRGTVEIGYCTVNQVLARDIQHLLLRFGVTSRLRWRKTSKPHGAWTVSIHDRDNISRFARSIGIFEKAESVDRVVTAVGGQSTTEAEPIVWMPVSSLEDLGEQMTYSVHVDQNDWDLKSFLANDIWSHNTEALVVEILWSAWTKPNKKPNEAFNVLVVCPYDKQVTLIFDRLRAMLAKSKRVFDSVVRDTANPQRIEFSNGAIILGVSAGVRSGGNADQVRGQDGDLIVLDETAMLDQKSIESIMAILASTPTCRVIASGTPTGTRNQFYQWSTDKSLGYREFHFTSRVTPSWDSELEMGYRRTYSALSFAQEFLAEFGEEEAGIFQQKYIDSALTKYELADCRYDPRNLYCMGVDWNSVGHGTHIVVQEYDTTSHMFRVVAKEVVETAEFTQDNAINRILYLDSVWHCNYIYVDIGFGGHQIETLRRIGMSMPGSNLAQKIKPIDFGSKTEIKDPFNHQVIKKYTKPLIVDLAARRMESYQCILPASEDYQVGLIGQIRAFKVESFGRDGRPVYSSENDHTLVAWMLSIFGLIMEYTDLAKTPVTSRVRFVDTPARPTRQEQDESSSKAKGIKAEPRWDPPKMDMMEVIRAMQTGRVPDMRNRRRASLSKPRRTSF